MLVSRFGQSYKKPVVEETLDIYIHMNNLVLMTPFCPGSVTATTTIIDWGDGLQTTNVLTHEYSERGDYIIKIKFVNLTAIRIQLSKYVNIYKMLGKITGCENLQSLVNFASGAKSLITISDELFDNCVNVINCSGLFYNDNLLDNIPSGLFKNMHKVTNFASAFDANASIDNIPSGLFDNCPLVLDFSYCFNYCTALINIPSELFDNCNAVIVFNSTFFNCVVAQAVPVLWTRTNVTYHSQCFTYCSLASNYADIPSAWK